MWPQVYIATPAYGGQVTVDYMTSVIHMVTQLKEVHWGGKAKNLNEQCL